MFLFLTLTLVRRQKHTHTHSSSSSSLQPNTATPTANSQQQCQQTIASCVMDVRMLVFCRMCTYSISMTYTPHTQTQHTDIYIYII